MKEVKENKNFYYDIEDLSKKTGMSMFYIRQNIKRIPHIKSGKKFLISLSKFEEFLEKEEERELKNG